MNTPPRAGTATHWEKTRRAAGNNKLARRSKDGILNEGDGGSGRIAEEECRMKTIIKEMVGYIISLSHLEGNGRGLCGCTY